MPFSRDPSKVLRAAPVTTFAVCAFAISGATAGALSGCGKTAGSGGDGTFRVTADDDGFKPSSVTLKKGAPATLVFTRKTDQTCATEVVFPELGIEKDLPRGVPVSIAVPTDQARTLTFQCGMGMYKSAVVIAE